MLKVLEQTNCRTGPRQDYAVVYTYLAWKGLEIVGNYPQENYWLVKSAESPTGTCWLWGEYVEVTGSYWVVSSVTPPPTATIPPPQAPAAEWEYFCSYATGQIDISFRAFVADIRTGVELKDVANGVFKSFCFAWIVGIVSCHQGLGPIGGPRGIGRSVTKALVNSIVLIVIFDFVLTRILLD